MTGVISGTPDTVSPDTEYLITAANSGGITTAQIHIQVKDLLPVFVYSQPTVVYEKGTAISANTPIQSGGAVLSYSISPSISSTGLNFNMSTGIISELQVR